MIETDIHDDFAYPDVINDINKKLTAGITPKEFTEIKSVRVSSTWTVEDLVTANLKAGYMRLIDGKLTVTNHPTRINLSPGQYDLLSEKAEESGQTITSIVCEIIDQHFVNS